MSWIDQLLPASFRGVPFQVHDINHQAGDTVVVREYPFQDLPTVFRMGEGAEEIKFSAYVIGEDYIDQREALRDVLSGEGLLIHPTAGSIWVYMAGRYGIKENPTEEGGIARFDLTFVRAESRRYPAGVENTESQAETAATTASTAATDQFAASFDLADAPGWVADRASSRLLDSVSAVWGQVGGAIAALGPVAEYASGMIAGYQTLKTGFDNLLSLPGALAQDIALLFDLPTELTNVQAARFQAAYLPLFDMGVKVKKNDFDVSVMPDVGAGLVMFGSGDASVLGTDGTARARLAQLNAASDQLIETLATAAYVRATARLELTSYDDAMAMRSAVHAQCMRLLTNASTQAAPAALPATGWHDATMALHTAALKDMQARTRDLVRLTSHTPQAWQPVWYVSYLLYGTASYADEIMALNPHIRHPLLVPPGKPLRVLRHD